MSEHFNIDNELEQTKGTLLIKTNNRSEVDDKNDGNKGNMCIDPAWPKEYGTQPGSYRHNKAEHSHFAEVSNAHTHYVSYLFTYFASSK